MQLYWISNEEIKLILDDLVEILTPDKLITKYGNNKIIMDQIQELLKNPKNDFLTIYDKILNESRYIEIKDEFKNYTAYELMIKSIMKTKKYKKGDNLSYSFRIKDELDNLEIENYLLEINDETKHYANVYISENELYVADIAADLLIKEIDFDQLEELYMAPHHIKIPLNDYLVDNEVVYVVEPIRDNEKLFESLQRQPIKSFVINYSLFS